MTVCSKSSCSCTKVDCYDVVKGEFAVTFTNRDSGKETSFDNDAFEKMLSRKSLKVEGNVFGVRVYDKLRSL